MPNSIIVGNYFEFSGWGVASMMYVKAAISANINFTCAPILYNYYKHEISEEIIKHQKTVYDTYESIIQIALPHMYTKIQGLKNIGVCFLETPDNLSLESSRWSKPIKQMDEIWVSTKKEQDALLGMNINAYLIPQPIDLKDYNFVKTKLSGLPEGYKFYYIGGLEERKNLKVLIRAYLTEFNSEDNVSLIIKTNDYNVQHINKLVEEITKTIRFKNNFPKISFVTTPLSDQEMLNLHANCDCLIMPSSAECPSRPVMDAICLNKPTIVTANTGMSELPVYMTIDSYEDYCYVLRPPFKFLYTGKETWQIPIVKDLAEKMRQVFEKNISFVKMNPSMNFYSLENVGEMIKCRLEI